MTTKTKTILKKILAYALTSIVLLLIYVVISFILEWVFGWFGGEKAISWTGPVAGCIVCTASIVIFDIINSRKKGVDRSDDIIRICRRILTTTTGMFCGALAMEWLLQRISGKNFSLGLVHWLSVALAVALFNELINKRNEKKMQKRP